MPTEFSKNKTIMVYFKNGTTKTFHNVSDNYDKEHNSKLQILYWNLNADRAFSAVFFKDNIAGYTEGVEYNAN
jgi:hypothetical protein